MKFSVHLVLIFGAGVECSWPGVDGVGVRVAWLGHARRT
jgi:hypothetical protein